MGVKGVTRVSPLVTEMSVRTNIAALSSAGTWCGSLMLLLLTWQWSKVNTASSYRAGRGFNLIMNSKTEVL